MGMSCGSQIVICDLPIHFDTYKGCSHACKYCFVKRKADISKIERDNCIEALKRHISGLRNNETNWCNWNIPLHWGGMSDPFQPLEAKWRISYDVLKIFAESKYPFVVSTKGSLVAEPEYLELIRKCNCVVQISAVCKKYDVLEAGAPTFEKRLEMIRKVANTGKRVIVRVQPYMHEVLQDILKNLERFKNAGAYGITIEGMKFVKKQPGLLKVGGDWCYPKKLLCSDYEIVKQRCHDIGLRFFCAENRLRYMGDDMCCCGIEGLEGFKGNAFNLEHIYNCNSCEPSAQMLQKGTAACFRSLEQNAGISEYLRDKSFCDIMLEKLKKGNYKGVCGADEYES